MRKFLTFIVVMFMSMNVFAQIEDPIIITAPDTIIDKKAYSLEEHGITISVYSGSAYSADHQYNNLGKTYFAVLAGGSMTISCADTIKGVAINGWVKKNFDATCDHGVMDYLYDDEDDVTGEPVLTISDIDNPSVTIDCVKQLRCFSIEVYFTENPDDIEEEITDTIRITMVTAKALDYSNDTTYSSEGSYSYWLSMAPAEGYPNIWLDMYTAVQGDLSGEYSLYDFNVGDYSYVQLSADEMDAEFAYDQEFTITKTSTGYHVEGWMIAYNDIMYEFVYDGPIAIAGEEDHLENVPSSDSCIRKLICNGTLLIERDGHIYNALGALIR